MSEAARNLKMPFSTFRGMAKRLGCYSPNPGWPAGIIRRGRKSTYHKLDDIFAGKFPKTSSYKLKLKLFNEKIKENKCEICGVSEWQNKPISCELDHIDGNSKNHELANLRILCPNCHSQTDTFRNKRGKNK